MTDYAHIIAALLLVAAVAALAYLALVDTSPNARTTQPDVAAWDPNEAVGDPDAEDRPHLPEDPPARCATCGRDTPSWQWQWTDVDGLRLPVCSPCRQTMSDAYRGGV